MRSLAVILQFICFNSYALELGQLSCGFEPQDLTAIDYVFVGEDHRDQKAKDFLKEIMPKLKSYGFSVIFVEYIESSDQRILDLYNQEPDLHLGRVFSTFGLSDGWGYDSSLYLSLTKEIAVNGYELRGLDYRERIVKDLEVSLALRDKHMLSVAKAYINRYPDKKIIFFNGSSHNGRQNENYKNFYELFVEAYPAKKALNLKVDYYDYDSVSLERLYLSEQERLSCDGFVFYSYDGAAFDYYIFEDAEALFPLVDTGFIRL